jgi:hypothetical protein
MLKNKFLKLVDSVLNVHHNSDTGMILHLFKSGTKDARKNHHKMPNVFHVSVRATHNLVVVPSERKF